MISGVFNASPAWTAVTRRLLHGSHSQHSRGHIVREVCTYDSYAVSLITVGRGDIMRLNIMWSGRRIWLKWTVHESFTHWGNDQDFVEATLMGVFEPQ